ncbi:PDPFL protein, partial [Pomatorhinus ruficollis]|nr:PDPFL protein [Pomatorhinus ruficollis]
MASVPSAGCLLAKNQYYRSECSCTVLFPSWKHFSVFPVIHPVSNVVGFSPLAGLPELVDKYWWIKSFFHSVPSPPTVGRKTLSAS